MDSIDNLLLVSKRSIISNSLDKEKRINNEKFKTKTLFNNR